LVDAIVPLGFSGLFARSVIAGHLIDRKRKRVHAAACRADGISADRIFWRGEALIEFKTGKPTFAVGFSRGEE
jgi:hypothetical protein